MLGKPRILSLFPNSVINSIKHEHSCQILYFCMYMFTLMDIVACFYKVKCACSYVIANTDIVACFNIVKYISFIDISYSDIFACFNVAKCVCFDDISYTDVFVCFNILVKLVRQILGLF